MDILGLIEKNKKYLKKQSTGNRSKKILSFAGAWKDMSEKDFQSLKDEIYERREKSFSSRRKHFSRINELEIANWTE